MIINICLFILLVSPPGREHHNSIKDVFQYYEIRSLRFFHKNFIMHYHYGCLEKIIDQKFGHYNENIIDV